MQLTDHEGRPVSADEPPDQEILVWTIDPALNGEGDYVVERSWQRMLDYIEINLETALEHRTFDELIDEPFMLKIGIKRMRLADYQELIDND